MVAHLSDNLSCNFRDFPGLFNKTICMLSNFACCNFFVCHFYFFFILYIGVSRTGLPKLFIKELSADDNSPDQASQNLIRIQTV